MKYHIITCCIISPLLAHIPLFDHMPELEQKIPYIAIGNFPTPVVPMAIMSATYHRNLYIKRDDLSGTVLENGQQLFGGNKVRKLAFLLADALDKKASTVLTFGAAGSNHATATATYAQQLGLNCICMLKKQPNSRVVQRNLLLMHQAGAQLYYAETEQLRHELTKRVCAQYKQRHAKEPYIIPTGGSNAIGVLGFVNAALELKQQIDQGLLPCPDVIYLPVGSMGTVAGLLLGCKLAGLKTKIIGIAVEPEEHAGFVKETVVRIFEQTNALLCSYAARCPLYSLDDTDYELLFDYTGTAYGAFTAAGTRAMQIARNEGLSLDGTYSAKAFAGLLDQLKYHQPHEVILFWHTFCSVDVSSATDQSDCTNLPQELHGYFTGPVQDIE